MAPVGAHRPLKQRLANFHCPVWGKASGHRPGEAQSCRPERHKCSSKESGPQDPHPHEDSPPHNYPLSGNSRGIKREAQEYQGPCPTPKGTDTLYQRPWAFRGLTGTLSAAPETLQRPRAHRHLEVFGGTNLNHYRNKLLGWTSPVLRQVHPGHPKHKMLDGTGGSGHLQPNR